MSTPQKSNWCVLQVSVDTSNDAAVCLVFNNMKSETLTRVRTYYPGVLVKVLYKKYFNHYLLTSVTKAENGFSQAYILMILMPDTTSFIMRILLSVRTAVLLLQKIQLKYHLVSYFSYCRGKPTIFIYSCRISKMNRTLFEKYRQQKAGNTGDKGFGCIM